MRHQLRLASLLVGFAAVTGLTACGDDGITLPDERAATAIVIDGGDDQTGTVGAPLAAPVEALVTDAQGRPVVDQQVQFTVAGGGTATPASTLTNASGIAATQWTLGNGAGTQSITARPVGNGAANVSATAEAVATAGPAASLAGVSGSPQSGVAGTALANPLVVQVDDQFGNGVQGVQVEWTPVNGGSVSEATTTTDAQGRASVTRTLGTTPGAQSTTAAVEGLAGSPVTFEATATVGSAGRLSITRQPSSAAQSGVAFGVQPQIQLRDAANNPVPQSGVAILAELASGPAGAALVGTSIAATNGSGVATFANLGISGPAGEYTLVFSGAASSLTGVTSDPIVIAAGTPSGLRFAVQPSNTVAGATISPAVRVELIDAQGNLVTTQVRTVSLTLQGGSGSTLNGTTSVATVGGVATFSNLAVPLAGNNYRLSATASGVSGVQSDPFSVSTGTATQLAFVTQPSAVDAGAAITPAVRVEVRDASGNPVTSFSGPVTVELASNPAGGTLAGTTTVSASGGVATFSDLSIDRAGTGYSLRAVAAGLTQATSVNFSVRAGTGSNIVAVAGDGQTAQVGQAVTVDPRVRVTDASNNPVSGVAITFAVTGGGGSVTGANQTTNSSGEAQVGSWVLGTTAGTNTLTATASGIGSVQFTATGVPASGSGLEFQTAPPGTLPSGSLLSPVPVVQIVDAQGNPVPNSGVPITIAISGGAQLSGTLTRTTDASGRAAFGSITVTGLAGAYTLSFSGQGTPLTSPLTITAGSASATQSSIVANPVTVSINQPTTLTITVEDAQGNPIAGASVGLSAAPGPGVFADPSLVTGSDGTAQTTFSSSVTTTHTITAAITNAGAPLNETVDVTVTAAGTTTTIQTHAPDPSERAEDVTVSFTVSSASGSPPGTVNVTSDEGASCSATTAQGACTLGFALAGTWTITATYAGASGFTGSSDTETHVVNPAATVTTIGSITPDPATTGETVTVAFTVTSPLGTPDGTVLVTSTEGAGCSAAAAAGECTLTFTTAGDWEVTAAYQGGAQFLGSSDVAPITVADPFTTTGEPSVVEVRRQPSPTAASGQTFSAQPEVRVRDRDGNNVADYPVSVELSSGPGLLGGRTTALTHRNGVGSWDDLRITGTGVHTLRFVAGPASATSEQIVVTP